MILKLTRILNVEIPDERLDDFKVALGNEDVISAGVMCETDFDQEGKVMDYMIHKQTTTVEVDTSGEFLPTIVVDVQRLPLGDGS